MNGFASTSYCDLSRASLSERTYAKFELLLCFELVRVTLLLLPVLRGVEGLFPTVPIVLFSSTTEVFGTMPLNVPGVPDRVLLGSDPRLFLL